MAYRAFLENKPEKAKERVDEERREERKKRIFDYYYYYYYALPSFLSQQLTTKS